MPYFSLPSYGARPAARREPPRVMPLAAAVFSALLLQSFLQSYQTPAVDMSQSLQQATALPFAQAESPPITQLSIALPPAFRTALNAIDLNAIDLNATDLTSSTLSQGSLDPNALMTDARKSSVIADAQQLQHNSLVNSTTDVTRRVANVETANQPQHPTAAGQTTPLINFAALIQEPANTALTPARFATSLLPANAFATSVTAVPPIQRESWLAFAPHNITPEGLRVVIDPGHGGSDPGTVGPSGQTEKVLTLAIARRVQSLLHGRTNIQVSLTRDSDAGLSRRNRLNHVTHQAADLLISLHLNNLPQQNITLVESFYAGTENMLESMLHLANNNHQSHSGQITTAANNTTQSHVGAPVTTATLHRLANASKRLSDILQHKVFTTVKHHNPRAVNAGVKTDTLYMLTRSQIPAALIELTCLSNSAENERLNTAAYREALSEAIARGIVEYFLQPEHSTGI